VNASSVPAPPGLAREAQAVEVRLEAIVELAQIGEIVRDVAGRLRGAGRAGIRPAREHSRLYAWNLRLYPPNTKGRSMPMKHIVEQGECLTSIASRYGFSDYTIIYNDPQNAAFKKKRNDPNLIYQGDVLVIPEREMKEVDCATGKVHQFQVNLGRRLLRIALKDHEEKAIKEVDYLLEVEGKALKGRTDSDGILEQKIPAHAVTGKVTLPEYGVSWTIRIGHLDPVHDHDDDDDQEAIITGIQARLANLGYFAGEPTGILGPETKEALQEFQRDVMGREDPDGAPDQKTRDALVESHGC
jgi:hypothetical protein